MVKYVCKYKFRVIGFKLNGRAGFNDDLSFLLRLLSVRKARPQPQIIEISSFHLCVRIDIIINLSAFCIKICL